MKLSYILIPLLAAVLMTGCASTSMTEMQSLQDMAQQAMDKAEAADAKAQLALDRASDASEAAQKAQACCEANTQRINRAFEASMQK
ncbi:MAG: Lpp/OprI family alanine-zipper lipoprotein [Pontibacterium sp.]